MGVMRLWLLVAVILLALFSSAVDAGIIHTAGLQCQPPAVAGAKILVLPVRYRVGAGLDKATVRQAFDLWENRTLKFIEDDAATNSIELETAPPGVYTEMTSAGAYYRNIPTLIGFNIWLDTAQIQRDGGNWGAVLVSQIARGIGLQFSGCSDALPTAWPTLSADDIRQRDLLYPPYSTYVPLLQRQYVP